MSLAFTEDTQIPGSIQSGGSMLMLVGTLTAAGSYAAGGDTFASGKDLEALVKRIARGRVVFVELGAGYGAVWDSTNKKLKLYTGGGAELAAAAYPATLTGGVPVLVYAR